MFLLFSLTVEGCAATVFICGCEKCHTALIKQVRLAKKTTSCCLPSSKGGRMKSECENDGQHEKNKPKKNNLCKVPEYQFISYAEAVVK